MRRSALPVDQSTAEYVVSRVRETLLSGRQVGASMLVQRSDTLDVVGVKKSVPGRRVVLPHLLAGLTSTWTPEGGRVEAIGVAGRFQLRRRGQSPVGVALVFLEWEDCSWWHWQVLLDAEGQPVEGSDTVRAARDGDPLPGGLGRWWTRARRHGIRMSMRRAESAPLTHGGSSTDDIVH
jgi:hypothetical protein